jgi:hypothetical protein
LAGLDFCGDGIHALLLVFTKRLNAKSCKETGQRWSGFQPRSIRSCGIIAAESRSNEKSTLFVIRIP